MHHEKGVEASILKNTGQAALDRFRSAVLAGLRIYLRNTLWLEVALALVGRGTRRAGLGRMTVPAAQTRPAMHITRCS